MNTKMYVGNLPYDATELDLRTLFASHGEVQEVAIVMDRDTGRSRGFAFVTMSNKEGMEAAIRELDGQDFNGRNLNVNEARPRENRPSGGGGYGGGGGGGGGYGGGGGGGGYGGGGGGGGYGGGKRKSGGGSRKGSARQNQRW